MLIGMYHFRKDPEKVSRAYLYGSLAKQEGVDFLYFTASGVDFNRLVINGHRYEDGKWIQVTSPFPDVVMNVVGPITPKQIDVYSRLKKMIPFTSNSVGTKLSEYRRIKRAEVFANYIIPYKILRNPVDALGFLKNYDKIILKPVSGHHGNKILFIENTDGMYLVNDGTQKVKISKVELIDVLDQLCKSSKMVIQRFITSTTKDGTPYDIRLHMQKDKEGQWVITIIYPKVGCKEKVATNLGQGGLITVLDNFLKKEFGEEAMNIKRYLEVFAIQFVNHFDTLYPYKFDELGIDVGLDKNHKIWIYEVNWRPGHVFIESKTAKHAVGYAIWLAKQKLVDHS